MKQANVISFGGEEALVQNAAALWLDQLDAAPPGQPFSVALSGGRIARPFFSQVVQQASRRNVALNDVEFFWTDERCVPSTDSESNFALAQEALFAPLNIQPARIHRVRGEMEPTAAAIEAEAEIRRIVRKTQDGQPVLDLVFLGMGEDGHTASLFPGEAAELAESTAVYRAVIGPKPPPNRVTLGYPAVAAASQAWVLVSGPGKEEALRRSLQSTDATPLGRLLDMRQSTRIFSDIKSQ